MHGISSIRTYRFPPLADIFGATIAPNQQGLIISAHEQPQNERALFLLNANGPLSLSRLRQNRGGRSLVETSLVTGSYINTPILRNYLNTRAGQVFPLSHHHIASPLHNYICAFNLEQQGVVSCWHFNSANMLSLAWSKQLNFSFAGSGYTENMCQLIAADGLPYIFIQYIAKLPTERYNLGNNSFRYPERPALTAIWRLDVRTGEIKRLFESKSQEIVEFSLMGDRLLIAQKEASAGRCRENPLPPAGCLSYKYQHIAKIAMHDIQSLELMREIPVDKYQKPTHDFPDNLLQKQSIFAAPKAPFPLLVLQDEPNRASLPLLYTFGLGNTPRLAPVEHDFDSALGMFKDHTFAHRYTMSNHGEHCFISWAKVEDQPIVIWRFIQKQKAEGQKACLMDTITPHGVVAELITGSGLFYIRYDDYGPQYQGLRNVIQEVRI